MTIGAIPTGEQLNLLFTLIFINMTTIINDTDYSFLPGEQQIIRNASANTGVDIIYTQRESTKPEDENLFHFYANEDFGEYLFSIDTDVDGSCVIWER